MTGEGVGDGLEMFGGCWRWSGVEWTGGLDMSWSRHEPELRLAATEDKTGTDCVSTLPRYTTSHHIPVSLTSYSHQ